MERSGTGSTISTMDNPAIDIEQLSNRDIKWIKERNCQIPSIASQFKAFSSILKACGS